MPSISGDAAVSNGLQDPVNILVIPRRYILWHKIIIGVMLQTDCSCWSNPLDEGLFFLILYVNITARLVTKSPMRCPLSMSWSCVWVWVCAQVGRQWAPLKLYMNVLQPCAAKQVSVKVTDSVSLQHDSFCITFNLVHFWIRVVCYSCHWNSCHTVLPVHPLYNKILYLSTSVLLVAGMNRFCFDGVINWLWISVLPFY